ncbi:MAG: hypothetical protein IKE94_09480, partial [Aeriscardovia sp.]|nr:hypothetical protein [Aeriscardovia sp.]
MTREEAISIMNVIIHMLEPQYDTDRIEDAVDMAIKALEQQPCEDAISRDAALEKMADYVASGYADSVEDFEEYSRIICQLPSVKPQEPKMGHWKKIQSGDKDFPESIVCSRCGHENSYLDFGISSVPIGKS